MDNLHAAAPTPPLRICGARQNNLKGFDVEIPHDCVVAVTGLSGSGKSSLAFDTVFAEAQWRFLESLPVYARMLMEEVPRPRVDALENVRPALALEQRNEARSARSAVGTATGLYDLFRLLYAAARQLRCPACGKQARAWTLESAEVEVPRRFEGQRVPVEVLLGRLKWLLGGRVGLAPAFEGLRQSSHRKGSLETPRRAPTRSTSPRQLSDLRPCAGEL